MAAVPSSEAGKSLRVAVLSQWLGPGASGTAGGLGRALARRGAQVEYATGPAWGIPSSGLDGPRFRITRETVSGVAVTRYPYYRSHDRSAARRLLTYASFSASTSIAAVPQLARADVVLVNCTPGTVAAAAMAARRLRGTPYVLLVQDVWPDSIFASGFLRTPGVRRWVEPPVGHFMTASYRQAAAVVGISPGMRDLLVSRGADPHTSDYVYNWADESVVQGPIPVPVRSPGEPLHLMYAGNLGLAQDLGNVLTAVSMLDPDTVRLTLVGAGAALEALRAQADGLGLSNVAFHPAVERSELPALMSGAHVHLISLADEELFRITMPSKAQFLLAAGVPILCSAPGEVAGTVEQAGAGLSCAPADPTALAAAIERIRAMPDADLTAMGARGRAFYVENMSEQVGGDKLMSILQRSA